MVAAAASAVSCALQAGDQQATARPGSSPPQPHACGCWLAATQEGGEAAPELSPEEYGRLVELVEQQEQGLRWAGARGRRCCWAGAPLEQGLS